MIQLLDINGDDTVFVPHATEFCLVDDRYGVESIRLTEAFFLASPIPLQIQAHEVGEGVYDIYQGLRVPCPMRVRGIKSLRHIDNPHLFQADRSECVQKGSLVLRSLTEQFWIVIRPEEEAESNLLRWQVMFSGPGHILSTKQTQIPLREDAETTRQKLASQPWENRQRLSHEGDVHLKVMLGLA